MPSAFTLTVVLPDESGPLHGFRILALDMPGRLGRLDVQLEGAKASVRSTNVRAIEVPKLAHVEVDGQMLSAGDRFVRSDRGIWTTVLTQPRRTGPAIQIVDGRAPIVLLCGRAELDAARRLAHGLHIYSLPQASIVLAEDALDQVGLLDSSNVIVIGPLHLQRALNTSASNQPPRAPFCAAAGLTTQSESSAVDLLFAAASSISLIMVRLAPQRDGCADRTGLLAMIPHPLNPGLNALHLAGTDASGLERALRAFPLRTGTPVPEFTVLGPDRQTGEVVAAGWWANDWSWSDGMSYM